MGKHYLEVIRGGRFGMEPLRDPGSGTPDLKVLFNPDVKYDDPDRTYPAGFPDVDAPGFDDMLRNILGEEYPLFMEDDMLDLEDGDSVFPDRWGPSASPSEAAPAIDTDSLIFDSAWVTDTRLMGVVCMYMCWKTEEMNHMETGSAPGALTLHQLFYFDCTEYGFDRYDQVIDDPSDGTPRFIAEEQLHNKMMSFIGGLGGRKIPVGYDDAMCIFNKYKLFNNAHGIRMPYNEDDYAFLSEQTQLLTPEREKEAMAKACSAMRSENEAANYFLMRYFEGDLEALGFLASGDLDISALPEPPLKSFSRNDIEKLDDGSLICRSIGWQSRGTDPGYNMVISKLTLDGLKISGMEILSVDSLSRPEVFMNVSHNEYVGVFDILGSADLLFAAQSSIMDRAVEMSEENGDLYMIYNENNDHVNKAHYRIFEDLLGCFFVSLGKQLLCFSHSEKNFNMLYKTLPLLAGTAALRPRGKFYLSESFLSAFMGSDYDDFMDFMQDFTS